MMSERTLAVLLFCLVAALPAGAEQDVEGTPAAPDDAPAADAAVDAREASSTALMQEAPDASLSEGPDGALEVEMADLREEILSLNRELFLLEEELLFPANTQVGVFLSMDVGEFFALDSVELRIDDREVGKYLYTDRELDALLRGGVHQLYLGNLKSGPHELVAVFTGRGPSERGYRRATALEFEKGIGAHFLELRISDSAGRQQPEFVVREWD